MTSFSNIVSSLPWPNEAGKRTSIGPVSGSTESQYLSELSKATPLMIVITGTTAAAHTLAAELPFFFRPVKRNFTHSRLGNTAVRQFLTSRGHHLRQT